MNLIHLDGGQIESFDALEAFDASTGTRTGEINGVPWIERDSHLFTAGKHKGRTYTDGDIAAIAKNFIEPKDDIDWTVPVQVDHSESSQNTTGSVRKVWAKGSQLWGSLRFIGHSAVQNVKSGIWRKLSSGIQPEKQLLHHVAVTPFPHIGEAQIYKEEAHEVPTDIETYSQQLADMKAAMEASQANFQAKIDAQSELIETQAKFIKAQQEQNRLERVMSIVDKFCAKGLIVPAQAKAETEFLLTCNDEQIAAYCKIKEASEPIVQFSQLSTFAKASDPKKDSDAAQLERMKKREV